MYYYCVGARATQRGAREAAPIFLLRVSEALLWHQQIKYLQSRTLTTNSRLPKAPHATWNVQSLMLDCCTIVVQLRICQTLYQYFNHVMYLRLLMIRIVLTSNLSSYYLVDSWISVDLIQTCTPYEAYLKSSRTPTWYPKNTVIEKGIPKSQSISPRISPGLCISVMKTDYAPLRLNTTPNTMNRNSAKLKRVEVCFSRISVRLIANKCQDPNLSAHVQEEKTKIIHQIQKHHVSAQKLRPQQQIDYVQNPKSPNSTNCNPSFRNNVSYIHRKVAVKLKDSRIIGLVKKSACWKADGTWITDISLLPTSFLRKWCRRRCASTWNW